MKYLLRARGIAFALFMILACHIYSSALVYVIPVETEIDMRAAYHFKKAIEQAKGKSADLLLLRINTFGGALDAADSIRTAILRLETPTVAFVDINAASAGALIALACDSTFMAPAASMGSATVVNGSGEPMPQKYQSYMSTMMRATAEHHGRVVEGDSTRWRRNPNIASSMVNPEVSVSLTARQAMDCGYADGIAATTEQVLEQLNQSDQQIYTYSSSLGSDLLGFLSNAAVRAVLIMLILGGIYMEMHSQGMGFPSVVALVASVLYFLPMLVSGTIAGWILITFILGFVLLAFEIFVIPGFGVCGIAGIISIVIALGGAMLSNDATTGLDLSSLTSAILTISSGAILALIAVLYLTSSHGPKFIRKHSELMTELRNSDGFVGVDMEPAKYIGETAHTVTELRPSGKIRIGKNVFDAVSTGDFIAANRSVKVKKYENAQLYVEKGE